MATKAGLDKAIVHEIEQLLGYYTNVLSRLIQFESTRGNEGEIQDFMKTQMERLGLNPRVIHCREDNASKNVVAVLEGNEPTLYKSLVLNAHCDIAPVDDPQRWTVPPFSGKIIDGKIYGRGAQDNRAGLVLLLLITAALRALGVRLKGNLILQSVIEDESSGIGTKALIEQGFDGDGAIVCDGTWPQRIIYAHLGQIWLNVKVTGEPVAACVEHRGVNPIFLAMDFITAFKAHVDTLKNGKTFEGLEHSVFLNVGSFHAGSWHGSVPSQAVVQLQVGFSDYHHPEDILQAARDLAAQLSSRIQIDVDTLMVPSFRTDPRNPLIQKLKGIIEKNSKQEVLVVPVTGHTDLRHFQSNMVCLYGPGGGKNPHGVDEHYFLEHLPVVARNIIEFILEWCNEKKAPSVEPAAQ